MALEADAARVAPRHGLLVLKQHFRNLRIEKIRAYSDLGYGQDSELRGFVVQETCRKVTAIFVFDRSKAQEALFCGRH